MAEKWDDDLPKVVQPNEVQCSDKAISCSEVQSPRVSTSMPWSKPLCSPFRSALLLPKNLCSHWAPRLSLTLHFAAAYKPASVSIGLHGLCPKYCQPSFNRHQPCFNTVLNQDEA